MEKSEINNIARKAGISRNPNVSSWKVQNKNEARIENLSEIKVFEAKPSSIFIFLENLDKVSGMSRIKRLSITRTRNKNNVFDLTILYSTYLPDPKGEKK